MDPTKPRRPNLSLFLAALSLGVLPVPVANALVINLDYSYDTSGFFSQNQTAQTIIEAAADYFESQLADDLLAIESDGDEDGVNNFTASFMNPSDPYGSGISISNFDVAADTITIFVGGADLGGGTLGVGGPGGFGVSGTSAFVDVAITRGEAADVTAVLGDEATDFALWGGSISFNSSATWYFDDDVSTTENFNGYDFYSVALHEMGHVLGIGTADSWENNADDQFTGAHAVAAYGGEVPLTGNGAHWQEGTQSSVDGQVQEAAMDPSIANGQRKEFTDLDLAGLEDVGWEVQAASAQ